jgi:hypothetical protein
VQFSGEKKRLALATAPRFLIVEMQDSQSSMARFQNAGLFSTIFDWLVVRPGYGSGTARPRDTEETPIFDLVDG